MRWQISQITYGFKYNSRQIKQTRKINITKYTLWIAFGHLSTKSWPNYNFKIWNDLSNIRSSRTELSKINNIFTEYQKSITVCSHNKFNKHLQRDQLNQSKTSLSVCWLCNNISTCGQVSQVYTGRSTLPGQQKCKVSSGWSCRCCALLVICKCKYMKMKCKRYGSLRS